MKPGACSNRRRCRTVSASSRRSAMTWAVMSAQGQKKPATDPALVPHGRVGEREMRLLRIALPLHDEGDVVHVDRMPGIGLLDDGPEVVADLGPDVQERPAQGRRMFAREDLRVGIVVEKGGLGPPGDEHRLVGSAASRPTRVLRP